MSVAGTLGLVPLLFLVVTFAACGCLYFTRQLLLCHGGICSWTLSFHVWQSVLLHVLTDNGSMWHGCVQVPYRLG